MNDTGATDRMRDRDWKRFLRGPDPMLLDELYVPALERAARYDRSCAYFSSSVLAAAARGFAKFIEHLLLLGDNAPKPAVRLLVNEQLDADDVKALTEMGDTGPLEKALLKRFKTPKDILEKQRLAMLGWLVKSGLLEVRVGVMRHTLGIMHAKFGIVYDGADDAVVFSGSGNETSSGLSGNYEQLEVSGSWQDHDRFAHFRDEFEALWKDQHDAVHTVTLPEAIRLKLIKFAPSEAPAIEPTNALQRQRAYMVWKFISEACYLPNGAAACDATAMVDLWPHQNNVVEETARAWPDGRLLCDEVGMGKTVEAILVIRRLLAGRGVARVLLLVPAGLLKQWQGELREKGGLIVPRLEGQSNIIWPDDRSEKVESLSEALQQPLLLMSRETARTESNVPTLLSASPWDLILLDEAHAARRSKQVETEFNGANLLLDLLRNLQLRRQVRGIMLLSATPMQTHPWEPWDLLQVLGEGDRWLADFGTVRGFFSVIGKLNNGQCDLESARGAAMTIRADTMFPPPPATVVAESVEDLAKKIAFAKTTLRPTLANWMRSGSPLARRMHRNTRQTLQKYYEQGLLKRPPAGRKVSDVQFDFQDKSERSVYDAVTNYIDRRFKELEGEKPGKGFVMTIYRRRASSSPRALRRSLERRRDGLLQVISQRAHNYALDGLDVPEWLMLDDMPDGDVKVSLSLPTDPEVARKEFGDLERLLSQLQALSLTDSKRDRFFDYLKQLTDDGRSALVFTEYTDTLEYLREALVDHYQSRLGCYSGAGGKIFENGTWKTVGKDTITYMLRDGKIEVLLCTDAASEGLNLQAAGALINYDLPWNPSKVEQRIGRIDRIGQKSSEVLIVNLFLKDSIDERVYGVLRGRCKLFEHFVGSMQPVLSRARRMLTAEEAIDLKALEDAAAEVGNDDLLAETYTPPERTHVVAVDPPIKRDDLSDAIAMLTGDFGPKAEETDGGVSFILSGIGQKKIVLATTAEALDADVAAQPLVPEGSFVQGVLSSLERPGERLPLVIGAAQSEQFRSAIAVWVEPGGAAEPITSVAALIDRLESWSGQYAEPAAWRKAETLAVSESRKCVCELSKASRDREEQALRRQSSSARHRLLLELGKYLVCAEETSDDLNTTMHHLMNRDYASAARLRAAFDLLGNKYPEWEKELVADLVRWRNTLGAGSKKARLAGAELEAAIRDPRWRADFVQSALTSPPPPLPLR